MNMRYRLRLAARYMGQNAPSIIFIIGLAAIACINEPISWEQFVNGHNIVFELKMYVLPFARCKSFKKSGYNGENHDNSNRRRTR